MTMTMMMNGTIKFLHRVCNYIKYFEYKIYGILEKVKLKGAVDSV